MFSLALAVMLSQPPGSSQLDPEQPYSATPSQPVTYTVEFKAIVTAPMNTRLLKVWVPIPPSDSGQEVSRVAFDVFPGDIKPTLTREPVFGNRFAYFEFPNPQGAQIITQKFQATVYELNWNVEPGKVQTVNDWPPTFDPFRRGESLIRVDGTFKKLAAEIAGMAEPGEQLYAVTDWVQANLSYDHSNTSLVASSEHALTQKRGDCSDYHGLCSSLGRSLGVPTRVTYGLHLFPKNLPSHCKLEAFLPPYGWVSFDVSETQRLIKRINDDRALSTEEKLKLARAASDRLRRGFRDNTWLLMTKGTDYELAPQASAKVPLVASIYAEADGKPLPTPDPADPNKREFGWMTAHKYTADKPPVYPFATWETLKK